MGGNVSEARTVGRHLVVVGGGISGLAAAHRASQLDPSANLLLLEAGDRLGGVVQTIRRDGFLIERGADSFITNVPWAADLCKQLGLDSQLMPTNDRFRRAFVVHRGKLVPVPDGFTLLAPTRIWPVLKSPLLSPLGKLRLMLELFVPEKDCADESLESFAVRRLGREVFERLVQPLAGGIYTADPQKLSIAATMPRFLEMERTWGSLTRAALVQSKQISSTAGQESGARYSLFMTLRDGLSTLVDTLAAQLPAGAIRFNARVERLRRVGEKFFVQYVQRGQALEVEADALILALPAKRAAELLREIAIDLAQELSGITYAGSVVITTAYRRDQIGHPLDGFGFVVPAIERRRILAASFSSTKFEGRAPEGTVLVRTFVGGACQADMAELGDERLLSIVHEELSALIQLQGEPILADIARWNAAMPQYHVGHCDRVERIEALAARIDLLALAGSAYRGVGIPHCIRSGQLAAERVLNAAD